MQTTTRPVCKGTLRAAMTSFHTTDMQQNRTVRSLALCRSGTKFTREQSQISQTAARLLSGPCHSAQPYVISDFHCWRLTAPPPFRGSAIPKVRHSGVRVNPSGPPEWRTGIRLRAGCMNAQLTVWLANRRLTLTAQLETEITYGCGHCPVLIPNRAEINFCNKFPDNVMSAFNVACCSKQTDHHSCDINFMARAGGVTWPSA